MKEINAKEAIEYDYAVYVDTRGSKQLTAAHDLTVAIAKKFNAFLNALEKALHPNLNIRIDNINTDHNFGSLYRLSISLSQALSGYETRLVDLVYNVLNQSLLYKGIIEPETSSEIVTNEFIKKTKLNLELDFIDDDQIQKMHQSVSEVIKIVNRTSFSITAKKYWSEQEGGHKINNQDREKLKNGNNKIIDNPLLNEGNYINEKDGFEDEPERGKIKNEPTFENLKGSLSIEFDGRSGIYIIRPVINGNKIRAIFHSGAENQLLDVISKNLTSDLIIVANVNNRVDRGVEIHAVHDASSSET